MEYSRTTGFCAASIIFVAAEANADDEVSVEADDAVRAEESDTENALLAVTAAAAAVADGDEFGGIFPSKNEKRAWLRKPALEPRRGWQMMAGVDTTNSMRRGCKECRC